MPDLSVYFVIQTVVHYYHQARYWVIKRERQNRRHTDEITISVYPSQDGEL